MKISTENVYPSKLAENSVNHAAGKMTDPNSSRVTRHTEALLKRLISVLFRRFNLTMSCYPDCGISPRSVQTAPDGVTKRGYNDSFLYRIYDELVDTIRWHIQDPLDIEASS